MKPDRNMSVAEVATMFNEVVPLRSDQQVIFSQLIDSITYCEKLGSKAWSITVLESGFRLNVGQVEAMTWGYTLLGKHETDAGHEMPLSDIRVLLVGADCVEKVPASEAVNGFHEMSYQSVGAKNWSYLATFQISTNTVPDSSRSVAADCLKRLRDNHYEFLKLACHTPTGKLRQKSNFAKFHCESLYAYAQSVVSGTAESSEALGIDEEALQEAVRRSLADSASDRSARLAVAPQVPARIETTRTVFQRNPDVIAEVLLRASGQCESCHKPAPFFRATDRTPYLEVHHIVALSDGGHDTVANAIGICPNCHRQAHYG